MSGKDVILNRFINKGMSTKEKVPYKSMTRKCACARQGAAVDELHYWTIESI